MGFFFPSLKENTLGSFNVLFHLWEKQFGLFLIPSYLLITKGASSFVQWQQVKEGFPWRWKEKSGRLDPKLSSEPIIDIPRPKITQETTTLMQVQDLAEKGGKRVEAQFFKN